jgi:hypothetical protein
VSIVLFSYQYFHFHSSIFVIGTVGLVTRKAIESIIDATVTKVTLT